MASRKAKSIHLSKTFWVAVLQAIAGLLAILMADNPTLDLVGFLAVSKSVVDTVLRLVTAEPVRIK